ncbi:MAG: DUF2284 domain-containing protein [Spirochaetota bacterium]|nr:DUF2284 domain-containing protein [Spirochaetota bacterium]
MEASGNITDFLMDLKILALQMGASSVSVITTDEISIEDKLAANCKDPGCMNYGQSASCPPYVAGPDGFRKLIQKLKYGLFFKIDVPLEVLYSNQNYDIFRLLHTIASHLEHSAFEKGFVNSAAFAGGSCKQLFCYDKPDCNKIRRDGNCRHPSIARPSMSGFGINVSKLMKRVGWEMSFKIQKSEYEEVSMANVCGLVLIG